MNKVHRDVIKRLKRLGVKAKYQTKNVHGQIYWYHKGNLRYITVSTTKVSPSIHKRSWGDISRMLKNDGIM